MRKLERRTTTGVLLDFTRLKGTSQELFISQMNDFLLSSSRRRKTLIALWESEIITAEQKPNTNKPIVPK